MIIQLQWCTSDDLPSSRGNQGINTCLVRRDPYRTLLETLPGIFQARSAERPVHTAQIDEPGHKAEHVDQIIHTGMPADHLFFRKSRMCADCRQVRAIFPSVADRDQDRPFLTGFSVCIHQGKLFPQAVRQFIIPDDEGIVMHHKRGIGLYVFRDPFYFFAAEIFPGDAHDPADLRVDLISKDDGQGGIPHRQYSVIHK